MSSPQEAIKHDNRAYATAAYRAVVFWALSMGLLYIVLKGLGMVT